MKIEFIKNPVKLHCSASGTKFSSKVRSKVYNLMLSNMSKRKRNRLIKHSPAFAHHERKIKQKALRLMWIEHRTFRYMNYTEVLLQSDALPTELKPLSCENTTGTHISLGTQSTSNVRRITSSQRRNLESSKCEAAIWTSIKQQF